MSYGGRNYIKGDTEYRGVVVETGTRKTSERVYDETEAEHAARLAEWRAANPGKRDYYAPTEVYFRKSHSEDRGLQPYEETTVYGPYATIGPARAAAGTGRGCSYRIETGDRHDGGVFTRERKVQVGTVEWKDFPE